MLEGLTHGNWIFCGIIISRISVELTMLLSLLLCALCLTQGIDGISAPAQIGVAIESPTLELEDLPTAPIVTDLDKRRLGAHRGRRSVAIESPTLTDLDKRRIGSHRGRRSVAIESPTLTACPSGQFACGEGGTRDCVPTSWICDNDNDCGNLADEQDCAETEGDYDYQGTGDYYYQDTGDYNYQGPGDYDYANAGAGSLPPGYLSVEGFEQCLGQHQPTGRYHSERCMPSTRPEACLTQSFEQLRQVFTGSSCPTE